MLDNRVRFPSLGVRVGAEVGWIVDGEKRRRGRGEWEEEEVGEEKG